MIMINARKDKYVEEQEEWGWVLILDIVVKKKDLTGESFECI